MMDMIYDVLFYYLCTAGLASALLVLWGWARGRQTHTKPVYGPFRANVRRIR